MRRLQTGKTPNAINHRSAFARAVVQLAHSEVTPPAAFEAGALAFGVDAVAFEAGAVEVEVDEVVQEAEVVGIHLHRQRESSRFYQANL